MSPLLSLAIPTYNGARTIKKMMDILLPQVDDRIEIIISDNASTDKTKEIIDHYRSRYPNLQYYRHDKNIGADANFLFCMRYAQGEYIYLLSDDDILVEGALNRILDFLENNEPLALVYLGTANFYSRYDGIERCVTPIQLSTQNIVTTDKRLFMKYAMHYWGFLSSFIINNTQFRKIMNPEQYFGTYWLQSYIHILCSSGENKKLGIVSGLCVGAGVYITQNNLDTGKVDGINYREMLDCAVENGFDKKQLDKWYIERLCLLSSHGIVKEKATGNKKIDKKNLFKCSYKYPLAWVRIYPLFFLPHTCCRWYMNYYRKKRKVDYSDTMNREGDIAF